MEVFASFAELYCAVLYDVYERTEAYFSVAYKV